MNNGVKRALVSVICMGTIATAAAQNRSNTRTVTHSRAEVRQKSSGVAVRDDSKKLNADLAKMESQTSRSLRPARAPHSKTVVAGKPITQQDRRSNPPINFSYSGKKDNVGHSGGASKATGKGPHMGPRLK